MSDAVPPSIHLAAPTPAGETSIEGTVSLRVDGEVVGFDLDLPTGLSDLTSLLPVFQGFADAIVTRGVAKAEADGRRVSCCPGCGVCCRQPVPVSEPEAWALAALVTAMPEPRRSEVRARFEAIERRLTETGLDERMGGGLEGDRVSARKRGLEYFRLGMACPFLQAEACSIYPDRPLICREDVVTSPAANCAAPSPGKIDRVEIAGRPSRALIDLGQNATDGGWLLLVQALSFAAQNPRPPPREPAPALVQAVFGKITGEAGAG